MDKERLINDLKSLHKKVVTVYKDIFDYKVKNNSEFKDLISDEYKKVRVFDDEEKKVWNNQFFHRSAYTLLNKILFIRICEDKGFMLNDEDRVFGENVNQTAGQKLTMIGLQKWSNLITNYSLSELVRFAFKDMNRSYSNISLYKEDKYDWLIPNQSEIEEKFINEDFFKSSPFRSFEVLLKSIIETLDTSRYNFNESSDNVLGDVYEKFLDRETRKSLGQFYTPDFVIKYILENTIEKVDVLEEPFIKILDPACGSGHFLIMAYDILRKKFKEKLPLLKEKYKNEKYVVTINDKEQVIYGDEYWSDKYLHFHLLRNCIYGSDVDGFAIQLTTINLLLRDLENVVTDELNIIESDSLVKWEKDYNWESLLSQGDSLLYNLEFLDYKNGKQERLISATEAEEIIKKGQFWSQSFDFIVGNPPYGVTISGEEKERLKKPYPIIEGKNDIYALFIYRSMELAKRGGIIGLITPNTFLGLFYYEKLRKMIKTDTRLLRIIDLPNTLKVFEDANIDTVIALLQNESPVALDYEYEVLTNLKTLNDFIEGNYNYEKVKVGSDNRILISNFVEPNSITIDLGKVCTIHQGGAFVGKGNNLTNNSENAAPYISGTDIDRYFLKWKGEYIPLDKDKVYSLGNEEHYKQTKIVMQRSRGRHLLRRIVACIDTEGFYCALGRTNYLLPISKNPFEVIGVLNSKYINYYYTEKYGFSSTDIIADSLRQLPYPANVDNNIQELVKRISKLYQNIHDDEFEIPTRSVIEDYIAYLSEITTKSNEILLLENLINILVYRSYGLDISEIKEIEEHQSGKRGLTYEQKMFLNMYNEELGIKELKNLWYEVSNTAVGKLEEIFPFETFTVEHINKNKSVEEIAVELGFETCTVMSLRERYWLNSNQQDVWKHFNLEDLENKIKSYLNSKAIELMDDNNYYSHILIRDLIKKQLQNFDKLVEVFQIGNINKGSDIIVKEALNLNADTFNSYIKKQKKGNKVGPLLKYDALMYGKSNSSDEVHKKFYIDTINYHTSTNNEEFIGTVFEGVNKTKKKAETALKALQELDFVDKQDYLEILTDKIKKAFD